MTLEQRTYTQRQVTDETAFLTERQFELEFSSTHSTSLDQAIRQQHDATTTDSRRGSVKLGVSLAGVTLGGSGETSTTAQNADRRAINVARKTNFEATANAAAKSRSEHLRHEAARPGARARTNKSVGGERSTRLRQTPRTPSPTDSKPLP
jgi:hypothetical protein